MNIYLFILGLVLFIFLIIAHEFGHFLAARRNGVNVEEFGLFFPPKIWSRRMKSGYNLSFNALPLGGFVRLKGEHDADTGKGSFGAASLWAKIKIMLAGITMNLLVAFIIFTFLALVGIPQIINNQFTVKSDTHITKQKVIIDEVEPNSPASKAGLQKGDVITAIGPKNGKIVYLESTSSLPTITSANAGKKVDVIFTNNSGKTESKIITLRSSSEVAKSQSTSHPIGYLGIGTSSKGNPYSFQKSTWSAPIVALGLMKQITILTFQGLGSAVNSLLHGNPGKASNTVTGPVGVVKILKNGSVLGYQFILFIVALISLSLAIINVLPIPALDGGRLFFTLVPRILTGKPIRQRTEEIINATGLIFLLMLITVVTFNDIFK